jgi:hypothetical protein
MSTSPARRTVISRFVGATIVAAALALGAGFGHLTSTDTPAHSNTPDTQQTCVLACADITSGVGGNVPEVTFNTTHKGGGGNR